MPGSDVVQVFTIVLLLHTPLIFQSLDVTDLGWHLTNQADLFTAQPSLEDTEWHFLLSQLAGGAWLAILGHPSVLWARLGGLLLIAASSAIAYSTLRNHFPRRGTAIPVIVTSLLITGSCRQVRLDYFSFPAALVLLQLWVLDRALFGEAGRRRTAVYSFLFGALIVPIAMGRLPLALLVLALPLALHYCMLRGVEQGRMKAILLVSLLGLACSSVVAATALSYFGVLGRYVGEVSGVVAGTESLPGHGTAHLMGGYLSDVVKAVLGTWVVIAGMLVTLALVARTGPRRALPFLGGSLVLVAILISITFPDLLTQTRWWRAASILMLGLLSMLAIVVLHFGRSEDARLDVLIICSWFAMLITPLGSNTGLYKAIYGMWLPLPLLYLKALEMCDSIPCAWVRGVVSQLKKALVLLLLFSVLLVLTSVYRDNPNRLKLTAPFSHPFLRGVCSTRERVDAVEGVLGAIGNHTRPGDGTLIVNSVPILYYLTETRPAMGSPWLFLETLEVIRQKQGQLERDGELPSLFCCNRLDSRDWRWPEPGNDLDPEDEEKLEYLLAAYSSNPAYRLVYETEAFSVFVRSS